MKFEKFLSIGLLNGFLLLITAVTIASCQKSNIHTKGYFTNYEIPRVDRAPASIPPNKVMNQFDHKQDSKQIYIYCYQNSIKVKQCYEHHFNQIMNDFVSNYDNVSHEKIYELRKMNSFEIVKTKVHEIEESILNELEEKVVKLVSTRQGFCKVNAKRNVERCMTQYITRDSLALLNAYQYKNKPLNGHEYIFLKNIIQKNLQAKLLSSASELQTKSSI